MLYNYKVVSASKYDIVMCVE